MRVIRFLQNRGSGSARKAGTTAARGRVTVWTDVDMTYPNDTIPQLVKELDGYDQVVGARTTEEGTMKSLRVPAKWFIRRLASFLTKTKIPDLNSGFRAFRTDVARQYLRHLPPGFSCVTTMTMTFLSGGYSVKYIPIEYGKRAGQVEVPPDQGHAPLRRPGRADGAVVQPAAPLPADRVRPVGARLGKLVYDLTEYDFHVTTNTLLILFAAFQVFAIGLLADLVVRVVARPRRGPVATEMHTPDDVTGVDRSARQHASAAAVRSSSAS